MAHISMTNLSQSVKLLVAEGGDRYFHELLAGSSSESMLPKNITKNPSALSHDDKFVFYVTQCMHYNVQVYLGY